MWGIWSSMKSALGYETLEVESGGGNEEKMTATNTEERQGLFQMLSSYIGKDITSLISLPVWVFEPLSFLQIMCEPMQYSDLLLRAATEPDPSLRIALTIAWVASGYSCAVRSKKPFNPILGETYEYWGPDNKWRFFAEQVSHHPPIGAAFCETVDPGFQVSLSMEVRAKFRGNSSDVEVLGHSFVKYPKFNDHLVWNNLDTCAHNLILGSMWIDHFGTLEMKNLAEGGYKAVVEFTRCGWTGSGRWQLEGKVMDPQGRTTLRISGYWNESIKVIYNDDRTEVIWNKGSPPLDEWGFNQFNQSMMAVPASLNLLPTDSRFRTDRLALQKGDLTTAGSEKYRLEEKQRQERRERETRNEEWVPKYFKLQDQKWIFQNFWNNSNNTKQE